MNLVDAVSDTIFYRAPDGRIVFRPWGTRGSCFLLDEKQRVTRARIQLGYYAIMLGAIVYFVGEASIFQLLGIGVPLFAGGNHLLFWFFARGLAVTSPPEKPSPEYARIQIDRNTKAFGRPLLWIMLLCSLAFVLCGVVIAALGGPLDTAITSILFFGLCAAVFGHRLRK